MASDIKAAFFDIDGTLTSFVTHDVPQSTKDALEELSRRGIATFICSGRPPTQLGPIRQLIDHEWTGFVTMNGQYCFDDRGYRESEALDPGDVRAFVEYIAARLPDVSAGFCELDYVYFNQITGYLRKMWDGLGKTAPALVVDDPQRTRTHVTYQLSAYVPEGPEQDAIMEVMPHSKALRWHPDFTDICPLDGGKPTGMRRFMKRYGWTPDQVIAFGDGGNDTDMLAFAGIGVAMGNATEVAKSAADYVTDDVDHDGILNALRHFDVL
ncbi:MAG: Cof-type HAD-IIB family hydrolase [Bifidobacteriaceae bacterium]|nr:Cof-type HAD-IIB family hydrolase [Bifidobacteriaceae bacterium]